MVMLDDTTVVSWSQYEEKKTSTPYPEGLNNDNGFVYIKYFKNVGVTTTTGRDPEGVLHTGHFNDVKQITATATDGAQKEESAVPVDRLLPVGRLDKDSTGVLLLTSDPRLPAWVLGANTGCTKVRNAPFTLCPLCSFFQLGQPVWFGLWLDRFFFLPPTFNTLIFAEMQVYEVLLNRVPKETDLAKWRTGVPLATASSTGKEQRLHPTLPCKVCNCAC